MRIRNPARLPALHERRLRRPPEVAATPTARPTPRREITISCLEHYPQFLTVETPSSAPVSDKSPALRHYAHSLQAARRHLRQFPEDTTSLYRQTRTLEGHIRRRMKTVKPTTGRLQP